MSRKSRRKSRPKGQSRARGALPEHHLPPPRFDGERAAYRKEPVPIAWFGEHGIDFEQPVIEQIELAARIPPAVSAAIMPDGHPGYALPIGGVIALENAVSPSFVGYDIACRVTLSILDLSVKAFTARREEIAHVMSMVSSFGLGSGFRGNDRRDHPVMEDPLWRELPNLKKYHTLAWEQLGSSGGGNHFFDALVGEVTAEADWLPLSVGDRFVAIMTHSGSRGTGNKIAREYVNLAQMETHARAVGIPKGYEWFSLSTDAGREYWQVMQLMGRYAQANHHLIHDHFLRASGLYQIGRWENHHNFAFKEGGLIIHRKGATPADKGRVGLIPGTSGTSSYLVEGLGNGKSLNSSSHGAGRPRSRTASKRQHDPTRFLRHMKQADILHFGVEPDETFMAYKDIERVMALQEGVLVRSIARMEPKIVIMGGRSDDGD
ncbi:MAG: RtcB family protein [Anaerolineaceae bacterium]|nr:RtcB family protein [Anaerolineaceae bacterium]